MPSQSTIAWLRIASATVVGFGILAALAALPATSMPIQMMVDLIFWPVDGAPGEWGPQTRFVSGVGGGVMTGWGVMLWLVSTRLYPRDPELGRTLILTSIGIWFVVDSAASIAAGAPLNAFLNVSFLVIFYVPLRRPVRTVPG